MAFFFAVKLGKVGQGSQTPPYLCRHLLSTTHPGYPPILAHAPVEAQYRPAKIILCNSIFYVCTKRKLFHIFWNRLDLIESISIQGLLKASPRLKEAKETHFVLDEQGVDLGVYVDVRVVN